MSQTVTALLLDDGELDDVQELLEEHDVAFGRVRGGAIVRNTPPPERLLVATPRRVDCVRMPPEGSAAAKQMVRIVIATEDSTTLREQLRRSGFDFLVRRPVHREALRLLLLRALYRGAERRGEERVPMGVEVSFRTGLLPRRATMVDLSSRGCRLLSSYALEPGRRVTVQVADAAGEPLALPGHVIRISLDEHLGPDGPYSAAIAFGSLAADETRRLAAVLEQRSLGPATRASRGAAADLVPPEARAEDLRRVELAVDVRVAAPSDGRGTDRSGDAAADERRRSPRGSYARRVPAFGDRAMRVLVARDLSSGGMRVERVGGLSLGDRLHLAIYGQAADEPTLVWATVARDDGVEGLALVFDAVDADAALRIEKVLIGLPAVESLHDDEARAMGTVVTEILER